METGNPLLKRLEPDTAEARDFTVVEKPDEHRMNADAVAVVGAVAQRIGNNDALPTWIDCRQSDNAPDCAGFGQF